MLLGREQQRHQVQHQVAGLERGDGSRVARQWRGAEICQRVAAQRLVAVDGRQVQAIDDGAHRGGRQLRGAQRLRMGGGAGQHRDGLPGLQPGQREHLAPGLGQVVIAYWHVLSFLVKQADQAAAWSCSSGAPRKSSKAR